MGLNNALYNTPRKEKPRKASSAKAQWYEEYRCGCVSPLARVKRDLLGYCPRHGNTTARVYKESPSCGVILPP